MKYGLLIFVFSLFFQRTAFGQNPVDWKPVASFSSDTIRVGEPVRLSLSVRYPSRLQILMPDTNEVFSTFELRKKDFYPTRTIGETSRDCVVYELATFNLEPVQTISLPVFEFSQQDSIRKMSNEARVFVKQSFEGPLPKNPVVQSDLSPVPVPTRVNYPYILIGMGIVILLILVVNIFFDRPIQKFIYLFLERRRHEAFLKQHDRIRLQLNSNLNIGNMESLLNVWKKYIQRVDGNPYTSLTSMEIFKILPDPVLKDVLQEVDRWIYGGIEMKDYRFNIDYVKQVAVQLYQNKREAIRNGKFE